MLGTLAGFYESQERYDEAYQALEKGHKTLVEVVGKNHDSIGGIYLQQARLLRLQGQYQKAETRYEEAIEICRARLGKDHPKTIEGISGLAKLHATVNQSADAIRLMDRAQRSLHQHTMGVLPVLSEPEQLAFLKRFHHELLQQGLSLVLDRNLSEENRLRVASWLVNGKALAQQALAERLLLARDNTSPEARKLLIELEDVSRELGRLTLGTNADRQRHDQLANREKELNARLNRADYRVSRDDPWVELDDIRQKLPRGSAYIDIARFDVWNAKSKKTTEEWLPARYVAWITPQRGDVQIVDLGPADKIDEAVTAVRAALGASAKTITAKGEIEAEKALRQPMSNLAQLILKPLRKHIDESEIWIISPDSNLWLVPWAALPLDDATFAIEKHSISCTVSGRDLILNRLRLDHKPTGPMIFADPDFDLSSDGVAAEARKLLQGQDLLGLRSLPSTLRLGNVPRLPGTAAEAKAVAPAVQKYAGSAPRVYTDKQALASVFAKAKGPQLLILATHGYFLPDQDVKPEARGEMPKVVPGLEDPLLRCGLLLAGCNQGAKAKPGGDTGVLTGREIVSTDLRGTELVVLSACETGLGQVRNGEGVAGLRQAFQLAGARSVVATLWQIPDIETARLMSEFFDRLADKKTKAEALREAQLAQIKARRARNGAAHPFFWAAFTLTGQ